MKVFTFSPDSLRQFKSFIADMHQAVQESAAEAEVQVLPPHGGDRTGDDEASLQRQLAKGGNATDYLARRIARDHPAILAEMKAGVYSTRARTQGWQQYAVILLHRLLHARTDAGLVHMY